MESPFKVLAIICLLLVGFSAVSAREKNAFSSEYKEMRDTLPLAKKRGWRLAEKGFSTGYGFAVNASSLPEGSYTPIFFQGIIGVDFPDLNRKKTSQARVELVFEPQVNLVVLRYPAHNTLHSEAGIGIGLQEMYPITKNLYPFIRVSVGPHYFSTKSTEQARGFLFSDNVAAGLYWFTGKRWAIHGEYRARHMSNANLFLPNHGINTFNFLLGISRFLE